VADERGNVGRNLFAFDVGEEFADVKFGAAAVANDERGDAHAEEVFGLGLLDDFVGVRVDVNEARRDDQSGGINFLLGLAGHATDGDDAALLDADVGEVRGVACAVHDASVADDTIVRAGGGSGVAEEGKRQAADEETFHAAGITGLGRFAKDNPAGNSCVLTRRVLGSPVCGGRDKVGGLN
jgi:hypothetical protein